MDTETNNLTSDLEPDPLFDVPMSNVPPTCQSVGDTQQTLGSDLPMVPCCIWNPRPCYISRPGWTGIIYSANTSCSATVRQYWCKFLPQPVPLLITEMRYLPYPAPYHSLLMGIAQVLADPQPSHYHYLWALFCLLYFPFTKERTLGMIHYVSLSNYIIPSWATQAHPLPTTYPLVTEII